MKTSQEWWNEVKADETKLITWLKKQYHGELAAVDRITSIIPMLADTENSSNNAFVLGTIAGQELKHSRWIGELLTARGIVPTELPEKVTPYWNKTLVDIKTIQQAAAVAALAEKMRLERITVIANDETAPADIRAVFNDIRREEIFHEQAFRAMSTTDAIKNALAAHEAGVEAIGLIQVSEVL